MPFRRLARDHALTEIYSYIVEAITREPGWHARYFGLSDAEARGERGGDRFPGGAALPPLRGEAPLRARLLVAVRAGRWHPGGLRGVPDGRDRYPVREPGLPRRHGRRLLLGRLPPRLDPLGPAAPAPDRERRRGVVAGARRRATSCASSSAKARDPRARRSPPASASTRSTRRRSSASSAPDALDSASATRPIRLVA